MNIDLSLLLELLISIGPCLIALRILAPPLIRPLGRIPPDDESHHFWLSYAQAMQVIAPFLLVRLIGSRLGRLIVVLKHKEAHS